MSEAISGNGLAAAKAPHIASLMRATVQQRGLERAGNRLLALARFYGVADHDGRLSGARQPLEAAGAGASCPVIEPVAQCGVRQKPRDAGPARGATVERPGGEGAEA